MKQVKIVWLDACSQSGWENRNEQILPELIECQTLGFVVAENDQAIKVAQTINHDQYNATISIPKSQIKSVRIINDKKLHC